jgi:hypothetical protein
MTSVKRLGDIYFVNGHRQKGTGYERRHLCDVCSTTSRTWKEFHIHAKTHTDREHLKALWGGVDSTNLTSLSSLSGGGGIPIPSKADPCDHLCSFIKIP